MSKSKKNVIDPENIIEIYGADAVRLFILSDSPPEKDVQWSDQGMLSSFKFLQKLWTLHQKFKNKIEEEKIGLCSFNASKHHFVKKQNYRHTPLVLPASTLAFEQHSQCHVTLHRQWPIPDLENTFGPGAPCQMTTANPSNDRELQRYGAHRLEPIHSHGWFCLFVLIAWQFSREYIS